MMTLINCTFTMHENFIIFNIKNAKFFFVQNYSCKVKTNANFFLKKKKHETYMYIQYIIYES